MMIEVKYLKDAVVFLDSLPRKDREKVFYNVAIVQRGVKDPSLFKKLEGTDIWEFRTDYNGNAYRLLAFWDKEENSFVVATHGFSKKTQKTPRKEIAKAETIRQEYFKSR